LFKKVIHLLLGASASRPKMEIYFAAILVLTKSVARF